MESLALVVSVMIGNILFSGPFALFLTLPRIRSISDRHTRFPPLIERLAKEKPKISKVKLCQLFDIPRSSHYALKKPKLPSLEQINLNLWVKQAYDQTKGSGGARTLSAMVSQQHGIKLTRYKAGKIMAQQGLISRQLIRHRYSKADKEHAIHDNLLKREFSPAAPNQVWTGDVTYIRTKQGWAYLAVVLTCMHAISSDLLLATVLIAN